MTQDASKFETYCKAVGTDDELGVVFGHLIVCLEQDGNGNLEPYVDLQNDHIPEDAMLKAALGFMRKGAAAKVMHEGDPVGQVLFCFPVTTEIAQKFGWTVPRTGMVIGWCPDDKALTRKFAPGPNGEPPEWTGFSIGGRGERQQVTQ